MAYARDHRIFSLALGTGLRLAEFVGLNVGDVFTSTGVPRSRIRLRKEIAKSGCAGDSGICQMTSASGGDCQVVTIFIQAVNIPGQRVGLTGSDRLCTD